MAAVGTDVERYSDPNAFAKEVNLPVLGTVSVPPIAPGASLSELLAASTAEGLEPIVESLAQTRQSLTLRSLLLAGFPHDPECFALGLALARSWSRRGLKVAVVDMDAWCPTIIRGPGEPAEGLVDVLEYGCSFQRVAWELVAGSLWAIGPGMHPAEESRLADHPEWDRAARVIAARVDVTLYVAPFLHKPGLTGRLSKRMDGVVLTASIERVGRAELRDAFLELWGSDAPIIGCAVIDPRPAPSALDRDLPRPVKKAVTGRPSGAVSAPETPRRAAPSLPPAAALSPAVVASGASRAPSPTPTTVATKLDPPPTVLTPPRYDAAAAEAGESALVAALEREIRTEAVGKRMRSHRRGGFAVPIFVTVIVVLAGAVGWFAYQVSRDASPVPGDIRIAGDETVLPAPEGGTLEQPTASGAADGAPTAGAPAAGAPTNGAPPALIAGSASIAPPSTQLGGSALNAAPPAEGKPYKVHVASFRSEEKVTPIVRALRLKGLDAWYEKATDAPGWYRVFVGRFATEDEARAYAAYLLQNRWVDRAHAFPSTSR